MNWFHALYSMAAVFMIIEFVWKFALIPLSLITFAFNKHIQNILLYLISLFPYYLMASYAAIIGLGNNSEKSSAILILGGVFLFLTLGYGIADQQRQAQKDFDFERYRFVSYKYYGLTATLIYYIYTIFDSRPAINSLTMWMTEKMLWIQDIPLLGIIIAILAFLYVIYIIFMGLMALLAIIVNILPSKDTSA